MAFTGKLESSYGRTDHNRSVRDVPNALAALPKKPQAQFFFIPPVTISLLGHLQSVERLPRSGGQTDHWLAFTKHHQFNVDKAGMLLVQFPQIQSPGSAWGPHSEQARLGRCSGLVRQGSNHPGGTQVCGQFLAVAQGVSKGKKTANPVARIDIFDLGEPVSGPKLASALRLNRNKAGEKIMDKVSCVALTRLASEQYLLYAHRYSDEGEKAEGRFYRSQGTSLQHAEWDYLGSHEAQDHRKWSYENINFLVEEGSGKIYLVGMRDESLDLHCLEGSDQAPVFKDVGSFKIASPALGGGKLRAGGGLHVTPNGTLVLYVVSLTTAGGPCQVDEFAG